MFCLTVLSYISSLQATRRKSKGQAHPTLRRCDHGFFLHRHHKLFRITSGPSPLARQAGSVPRFGPNHRCLRHQTCPRKYTIQTGCRVWLYKGITCLRTGLTVYNAGRFRRWGTCLTKRKAKYWAKQKKLKTAVNRNATCLNPLVNQARESLKNVIELNLTA